MMTRNVQPKRGRSTLHVVAGLLLASALIRLGAETGPALAEAAQNTHSDRGTSETIVNDETSFLAALQAREARLDEHEARIDEKLKVMQDAKSALDAQIQALADAEAALAATIAMAETASQTDVAQLTTVYENMKPKEAAALFEEMSPEFAAGFLALMRPDVAAAIMTQLSPETAYSFSVVLAGRNADTPIE